MKENREDKPDEVAAHVDRELEELIPGFLQGRQEDAEAIFSYLQSGDYESIRVVGHTMKGTGGGYGFDAITDIGRAIEIAAKEKNQDQIRKQVETLKYYLANVKIIYE